jgi:hypothetical protein
MHQVCVITTEVAEENNDDENLVVDTQGNNPRSNSGKEKEKVYVFAGSGELSCQQLIMAQRYPQIRGEKS